MFSYAHKDDKLCYHILKEVEQMKNIVKVWIDVQQCAMGDLWGKIADAIEYADVILCFISEYYHQSKSCRQEFIYAVDDLQKPIIPILIGDYKPKGWLGMFILFSYTLNTLIHLGIRKAGMKYIRFRNVNEPNQSEITDLIERIQAEISRGKNINSTSAIVPLHHDIIDESTQQKNLAQETSLVTVDLPPVSQWTPVNIRHWFNQQGILEQIYYLYGFRSGIEMLDYAQTLSEDRDMQQKTYSQVFTQKYQGQLLPPHEFTRFAKAMEELLKENSTEYLTDKQRTQSKTPTFNKKSSICVIL